jgi:hypothetical protein
MNSASGKVSNEYLKNNRHSIGKFSSSSALSQSGTKVLSNSFLNLILLPQALFYADLNLFKIIKIATAYFKKANTLKGRS